MNSSVSSASLCACSAAVCTSVFGGRIGLICSTSCCGRTPALAATRDLVELARLVEDPLGGREVEARERRAADRRDGAELDDAGDAEVLHRAGAPGCRRCRRP